MKTRDITRANLELRMYGLVMYNISPIQQGIQFGHAVVEYAQKWFNDPHYQDWAQNWKTFIILNGGTSNHTKNRYITDVEHEFGTMEQHSVDLDVHGWKNATFFEPDLNDSLSAIVFLVDERVFNREAYPDYAGPFHEDGRTPIEESYWEWKMRFAGSETEADQIVWMRDWLRKFRLA
jgi:hypothetical protein